MGKKRKDKKSRKSGGLAGVSQVMKHPIAESIAKGGLLVLTAIAAGGAGAAVGRHSLLAGVPVAILGYYKKNNYLIAAGLGLTLSNGFQNPIKSPTVQGVDGFDMKQIADQAKDRVSTFFKNFSDKLYLPKAETGTAGLEGNGDEVTYFVNPYNNSAELDMSAIDRLQQEIAEMNGQTSGVNTEETLVEKDIDREF